MTCQEYEVLLCDLIDGALSPERKAAMEAHGASCPACAELARDVNCAAAFLKRVEDVDPPAELITRILFETRLSPAETASAGFGAWLRRVFEPVLSPRFAMGMAMSILSFSLIGRYVGLTPGQFRISNLSPSRVVQVVDDRVHAAWQGILKYYDSLRLVYEIQSRLKELTEEAEEAAPETHTEALRPTGGSSGPVGHGTAGGAMPAGQASESLRKGVSKK